jgi:hypothetical protein
MESLIKELGSIYFIMYTAFLITLAGVVLFAAMFKSKLHQKFEFTIKCNLSNFVQMFVYVSSIYIKFYWTIS